MPPVGFEPTISAGERPQNYALDRAATGTGIIITITITITKPFMHLSTLYASPFSFSLNFITHRALDEQ